VNGNRFGGDLILNGEAWAIRAVGPFFFERIR